MEAIWRQARSARPRQSGQAARCMATPWEAMGGQAPSARPARKDQLLATRV